ncbi:MAG TPA: aminopeptidase P family protein [Polyangiaceae bacterium LLY-WYZ-15_(1-7)]|nr:aminopeptidase P family protein [Polyangiaceae bacterium LLY-WYZ-15_(1-7)]
MTDSPFAARRARLAERFAGPALVFAGAPSPRNYPANPHHPFRASSHFLYLVGRPLAGGVLRLEGGEATLHLPPPPPGDALWHGETPSFDALGEALGLPVRSLDALEVPPDAATIPAPDLATRLAQEARLARPLAPPTEADLALQDALIALRLIHDAHAQAELRRAAEATVAAHRAGMAATHPGATEAAVHGAMVGALLARGATTAYPPILSVRGKVLHNPHHDGTCAAGDLLLADVGAETAGGWAGDVTRTWPVSGAYSSTQRAVYEIVLAAQREAIALCRPGVRYRDVHLAASRALAAGLVDLGVLRGDPEELVADGVHALLFPHGVGHLIGLDVHDMEDLGDRAGYAPGRSRSAQFGLGYLRLDRDLAPGMAVTIEPGFYRVPAILEDPELAAVAGDRLDRAELAKLADVRGVRIEDDVLITEGEPEVLTAALEKEPDAVEGCVGG